MNLLQETINELSESGKSESDVVWVGTESSKMTWDDFKKITANFDYDSGYGTEVVNLNLLVVGSNWWLERHEYDGSEWWEFKEMPKEPEFGDVEITSPYSCLQKPLN